jgi:hypothetical protein
VPFYDCLEKKGASNPVESGKGNHQLNPNYITGFVDGEGCFHITIAKKTGYKTGYSVNLSFSIGLHSKDADLLRTIQAYFGGIGILSVTGSTVLWRVLSVKELMVIINHFDQYPLITKKRLDFILFKEAFQLFIHKEHLTPYGLIKMASIKASINKGLSINLKEAFPTAKIIDPSSLPSKGLIDVKEGKSINPYWVAGFTEAEGCFFVITRVAGKSKASYSIRIGYQVSQDKRDQSLIKSLKDFFECGRTEPSGKAAICFRVTKFNNITENIIPFFENYPILGSKLKDFKDWKEVAKLMASKAHLTPEGLNEIKNIKSGMNSLRVIEA